MRIRVWGLLYYIIIRNPQNSIGNYLDPILPETPLNPKPPRPSGDPHQCCRARDGKSAAIRFGCTWFGAWGSGLRVEGLGFKV